MRIFVIGGTGALGAHAVPALLAAGHEVVAVARNPSKAAALTAQGAQPVEVSIFDPDALTHAMQDADAVINLATAIPPTNQSLKASAWTQNTRLRTEGAASVVRAALAAKVSGLIQESVTFVYPDQGDAWIDETTAPFPMASTKPSLSAESCAERFSLARKIGIVLRFGALYGPGAGQSQEVLTWARRGVNVQLGPGEAYISSIHTADAATAIVAALGAPAGVYNIVDDEPLTRQEYGAAVAAAAERTTWLTLPGRFAQRLGAQAQTVARSQRVSNAKFKQATGWAPAYPSAREGFAAMAAATG